MTAQLGTHPWLAVGEDALEDLDLLFVRGVPGGSLEQVIFRVDALHRLENAGVRLVNTPATIERTVDKYYTSTLLEDAGIPTPRTVVTENLDQALAAFENLGGDVVIKPLFGSEGRGMVRVSDADTARRVLLALELGRYVYYLQQFVAHDNQDVRVFVVGGQVVSAMVRHGTSWKTNVAQGATAAPLLPDDLLSDLALRATRAVGADYAGVDILATQDGYTVIEVNGIPGWRGLQSVTHPSIADYLVQYALRLVPK
jgi:ribosomal protein S6--L-glutamate ligase/tetrahydromethanopterin:alpha-L-glutamate ligase